MINSFDVSKVRAARVMKDESVRFRWLIKKDGTKTLQVACPWDDGRLSGIEWRDVQEVEEQS